ncbi:MAG: hypothetical protein AAB654_13090 [Acidobacteriota bacterium]
MLNSQSSRPASAAETVTQAELRAIVELDHGKEVLAHRIRARLLAGAQIEPGELWAEPIDPKHEMNCELTYGQVASSLDINEAEAVAAEMIAAGLKLPANLKEMLAA